MSRYLVTGAAGFIGSHLVEALQAGGHDVVALDSFTDHYPAHLKQENSAGFDVMRAHLSEEPLTELVSGVDGIFHLAAKPGVRSGWGDDFADYLRDNVLSTHRLFAAAAAAGVRVVWASSSSVYGDAESYPTREDAVPEPISPYGVTKLTCERLAHTYERNVGLDAVTLRYFTVYGPRQRPDMAFTRIATALAEGRPFQLYGDGSQSRGFTFVSDVVAATVAAMSDAPAGAVYNVGGGSEASMREIIDLFESVAGRKLDLQVADKAAGDVKRTAADTTRIRSDLSWAPTVEVEQGIAAHWEWAAGRVAAP